MERPPRPTVSWRRRFSRMASGKRASMREGPLAALFRKTEEEGLEPGGERRPEDAEAETRERAPEAGAKAPARPAHGAGGGAGGRTRRRGDPGTHPRPEPARASAPCLLRRHSRERARSG